MDRIKKSHLWCGLKPDKICSAVKNQRDTPPSFTGGEMREKMAEALGKGR